MPLVAKHVRLTNSGKIPDLFLTAKVTAPSELADAKLGKLYFVLQIDSPWSHASPIGSSIMNVVSREYYRQEGHVPLENFERAIAKANRLIEQLIKDGETNMRDLFHALIVLVVGDELHIAYAGEAEAYFIRDEAMNIVTEQGAQKGTNGQIFNNIMTGELSAGDTVILGSPGLYGAFTTDELNQTFKLQGFTEGVMVIARRLKAMRVRKANAIFLHINSLHATENTTLTVERDTLYLDQAIDSTWSTVSYYLAKIGRPIAKLLRQGTKKATTLAARGAKTVKQTAKSKLETTKLPTLPTIPELPKLKTLTQKITLPQTGGLTLPKLSGLSETVESGVPVHHYGSRRTAHRLLPALTFLSVPLQMVQEIGKQFRRSFRRSPRTWYFVASLLILASIGASIQTRKKSLANQPVVTSAIIDEIKSLNTQAKQARVQGNNTKARELYIAALTKIQTAKTNSRLAEQATALAATTTKDLYTISNATQLTAVKPTVTLAASPTLGTIYEGTLYYPTSSGQLMSMLLTGGEPTELANLPGDQAINQLYLDTASNLIYLQTYQGELYSYSIAAQKLSQISLAEGTFPTSTGLGTFGDTLYVLDPAESQIWKYAPTDEGFAKAAAYIRGKKSDLSTATGLSIDGSLFVLLKNGTVTKYSRGQQTDFQLNSLPVPFDTIAEPLGFAATEDADRYYLFDRGNSKIDPRIIEFDKNGKFIYQYFLPKKWQKDIRLVTGNPKSHKAWIVVGKDLYEFTLVQ